MPVDKETYNRIAASLQSRNVTLVAVSKTKPVSDILELYDAGQRDFGENYVQELVEKQETLPKDIRWHFIGHLQTNKVKAIAPFVYLIHGVDSYKLLKEINKQAARNQRTIPCLLQVHIAREETKFGFNEEELEELFVRHQDLLNELEYAAITGFMGMATFTDDPLVVRSEFQYLKNLFDKYKNSRQIEGNKFMTLSMGMSGDFEEAIADGSTMVRIGSLLFGARDYIV